MTKEELQEISKTLGPQFESAISKKLESFEATVKKLAEEAAKNGGHVSEKTFTDYKEANDLLVKTMSDAAVKQGTTIAELENKLIVANESTKSISDVLRADEAELKKIHQMGGGTKAYMVGMNSKGQMTMKPLDESAGVKTVGPNATISGIGGASAASIAQNIDAVSLLRMGAGAMINGQYRNTSWIFDLCNTVNASFIGGQPFAIWFDEQAKDGSSTTVAEGAAKPLVQYKYQLNTSTYKKEAALVGFTQEFQMDFSQLESDIMNKARIDVINRVNQAILPDIISNATLYSSSASFVNGDPVPNANDFDAIAALAAQVDNATFGAIANAAVMGTNKKYRMGITKNTQGSYLNPPDVISNIGFVGNPSMDTTTLGTDGLMVGDFKQYNIILRGGLIVRVGFNGTDFAQNMYSTVLEQFYFNYISTVRKVAIVKGPDFATVKTAIGA
jgi:hypothetical protein